MGKLSPIQFIKNQCKTPLPVNERDLSGQVVIVTGSNTGLGFEAAKHFARMKPEKLILACRNQKKAEVALKELREETGYAGGDVWMLDQGDLSSVVSFAEKFNKDVSRLDVLVANAGISTSKYEATKDGYESTVQVNHLATALLSLLLLPKMAATKALPGANTPRLTIVSSETHFWSSFDEDLMKSDNFLETLASKDYSNDARMGGRYMQSKLLNVFFTRSLASHLPLTSSAPVIINTVNPGLCNSSLMSSPDTPWYVVAATSAMTYLIARTTEVGSRQLVWAALEGTGEEVHGAYCSDFGVEEPADLVLSNEGLEKRIWVCFFCV